MTVIEEQTRSSFLQQTLRLERKAMRRASAKQTALNKRVTELRRATEDRKLARQLDCEVTDFAY